MIVPAMDVVQYSKSEITGKSQKCPNSSAMALMAGVDSSSSSSSDAMMTISVANASCLQRVWPSSSVGLILLLVTRNMLAYPFWALLFAKYIHE